MEADYKDEKTAVIDAIKEKEVDLGKEIYPEELGFKSPVTWDNKRLCYFSYVLR